MKLDMLHEAIGLIDFDLIEESEAAPEKAARVTAFAKPWMKWAVAAVLAVVIGVGTPVALRMMGVFRNENFVSPSGGNDNSGVVTPVGSSEDESGEPDSSSEPASGSSEGEKPQHGDSSEHSSEPPTHSDSSEQSGESENPSGSGQVPQSETSATWDDPGTGGEPGPEGPTSGEFIKDNMPPITYRIAGESKTFSYTVSEWVTTHWASVETRYSIDRYVGSDGSSVLINSETGKLIQYEMTVLPGDPPLSVTSEVEATELAKLAVLDTDIALSGIENAEVSVQESAKGYYITLTVPEGKVYVSVDTQGSLMGIYVDKRGS